MENEDAADALTEHQAVILDAIRLLNRVEVRGGAGSGKTFLAVEQARRLAAAGQRVALVCYSHGLASYLERITAGWSRRQQPGYVGEFHSLGMLWGASSGPDEAVRTAETDRFWEHDLPAADGSSSPHNSSFRVIGSTPSWSTRPRTSPTTGGTRFSPSLQRSRRRRDLRVQRRGPARVRPPRRSAGSVGPAWFLTTICATPARSPTAFQPLVDHPMRFLGGDGPAVTFVPCARDGGDGRRRRPGRGYCWTKAGAQRTSRC